MGADTACVVVPIFNEAAVLGDVLQRLRRHFEHLISVDDGSSDDSRDIALAAGATVLRHPVNLGQDAALPTVLDRGGPLAHRATALQSTTWADTPSSDG